MSAAHPWLEPANWPKTPLPRPRLEDRIERVLTITNIGVLSTLGKNGPIGSPVEFYADGLSIYILPQPNSPKLKAMQRDPRVSFAVMNPMAGWACTMGAQLFGKAKLLDVDTPEWRHGMGVFKWPASSFEIGRSLESGAPKLPLMCLAPDRIVYTEHYLRKEGFSPRQIWLKEG